MTEPVTDDAIDAAVKAAIAAIDVPEMGYNYTRGNIDDRDIRCIVEAAAPVLLGAERERVAQAIEAAAARRSTVGHSAEAWAWTQAAAVARGPAKQYIALGTKDEIRTWIQEHQIKPSNVYTVNPGARPGALRGLSGDFEVLTFPGWAKASPSLIEATEQDIRIIRATQPAAGKEGTP